VSTRAEDSARRFRRDPPREPRSLPRYQKVAAIVREQLAGGVLAPGAPAPSAAALARVTGYSGMTCRRALRALVADGVLVPGASPRARLRVPGYAEESSDGAARALSACLVARRSAAGLTQPQLAELVGMSVTTVGHAETRRLWQSRVFWERADQVLHADGELLRLHDAYRAAQAQPEPAEAEPAGASDTPSETGHGEPPVAVTVNVPGSVTCIAVTWADGAVTTVYPPVGRGAATTGGGLPEQ
jgi:DNA-binding transcriptional regulator YhcF (GntR family)